MTLGERIQDCRKNAGLSQEALGEAMGVTRQSISKWESDTTIPELDKLVALSKLFHIPVGALLGVEEGEAAQELTERELKALAAIAEKLTPPPQSAPAPEEPPKKKLRWPRVLVACTAVLVLLFWVYSFSQRMYNLENQVSNVQHNMNNIDRNVSMQISGITGQVRDILDEQNKVTADMGYEIVDADLMENTVTFRLWAVPRTHQEGMTAQFTAYSDQSAQPYYTAITNEGSEVLSDPQPQGPAFAPVSAQGTEGEGHRYEATLTCPLNDGIALSVTFQTAGESQNQVIGRETELATRSRLQLYGGSLLLWTDIPVRDGVPTLAYLHPDFDLEPGYHPVGKEEVLPAALTLRLWRGEKLVGSCPVEGEALAELANRYHTDVNWELGLTMEDLEVGEPFYLSVQITDSVGRQYERCLDAAVVEVGGTTTIGQNTTVNSYRFQHTSAMDAAQGGYPWEK